MDATNNKVLEVFDTEELSVSLAKYTAVLSDKFAKERGSFTVVLSGVSLVKSLRYQSFQHGSRWACSFSFPRSSAPQRKSEMGYSHHRLSKTTSKENYLYFPCDQFFFIYSTCGVCAGKADVVQSAVGNGKNSDMLPVQTVSPEGEF
ncbi:hypothetical protein D5086_022842 [Populus alba]|uniref:Uncharacterized protein n=1 Tax=Populus alba TaxID=43335 RepID=A0ACC4B8P2_POPAL